MTTIKGARTAPRPQPKTEKVASKPKTEARSETPAAGGRSAAPESTRAPVSGRTRTEARTRAAQDSTAQQLRTRTERATGDAPDAPASREARSRRKFSVTGPELTAVAASSPGPRGSAGAGAARGAAAASTPEGWASNPDGTHTFNGTTSDDTYAVRQNASGDLVVRDAAGTDHTLPAADARNGVSLHGLAGDDRFTIDASVRYDLTLNGGTGNDTIDGRQARGDLTLSGGGGADVLRGGRGNDVIKGGLGDDRIFGGEGADQLLGHAGDDRMYGGDDNDQLVGGTGDDKLYGGEGDDLLIGRQGEDTLNGGRGSDAIYADADDTSISAGSRYDAATRSFVEDGDVDMVIGADGAPAASHLGTNDVSINYDPQAVEDYLTAHPELQLDGDSTFRARVKADLGVMLSTPEGQGILDDLTAAAAASGDTLTLAEKLGAPGGTYNWGTNVATSGNWAATYGDGGNRHPLPVLYHELVHAYQDFVSGRPAGSSTFARGGPAPNVERQATGLPWIDAAGTAQGPDDLPYSDNAFRRALGLPERQRYGNERGAPTGYVP